MSSHFAWHIPRGNIICASGRDSLHCTRRCIAPTRSRECPVIDPSGFPSVMKTLLVRTFVLVWLVLVAESRAQLAVPSPNVVVILADDLGYGDVSFNGCPDFTTPNIDSLTNNGVRCSNGYATHPFCSPSRAGLLTGRYQQRFGYENQPSVDASNPRLGIPAQEVLLPQILKPAGYVCGMVGKWHLGVASSLNPTKRGFDEFFGFLGSESPYYYAALLRGTKKTTATAYLPDAFTRGAVS